MFEVKVVDVHGLQFVHHHKLVDTVELSHQLAAEQWSHGCHQPIRCATHLSHLSLSFQHMYINVVYTSDYQVIQSINLSKKFAQRHLHNLERQRLTIKRTRPNSMRN